MMAMLSVEMDVTATARSKQVTLVQDNHLFVLVQQESYVPYAVMANLRLENNAI